MSPLTLTLCVVVVVWALAAIDGGNDGILEVPKLQEATAGQPAHEVSRLRTWGVREGRLDATPLVAPTTVPVVPERDEIVQGDSAGALGESELRSGESDTGGRDNNLEALICSYSWSCDTALRIAGCESGLRAEAISWTGESFGLFQIWQGHAWRWLDYWEAWSDPVRNTQWAYELWSEQGWTPWDCW